MGAASRTFFRPTLLVIELGKVTSMADHPHTIDRWDDATGENLIERIAGVSDYLVALEVKRISAPHAKHFIAAPGTHC